MRMNDGLRRAALGALLALALAAGQAAAQAVDDGIRPLSPVIGLEPIGLDFGECVLIGQCRELVIDIFNNVNDPTSILNVTAIDVTGPGYSLVSVVPPLPLALPGDRQTRARMTVRYCPTTTQTQEGMATITAPGATNSPRQALFIGRGNTPPLCAAGGPYAGQTNAPIQFDGTGSSDPGGTIIAYAWSFGDGGTGTGPTPTHTYTQAGNFTATLTVRDDCGATSRCDAAVTVTLPENLPPLCDAGGPYAGPTNTPIQFDGTGSSDPDGTIVLYEWDFGDGATGSGPTPTHAYTEMGLYTVTLCVTDDRQARVCCETTAEIGATPVEPSTWGQIKSHYRD